MEILALYDDPVKTAQALDDQTLKAQLDTTMVIIHEALHVHDFPADGCHYPPQHQDNPLVLWASKTLGNFKWLTRYMEALMEEHVYRHGRTIPTDIYRKPLASANVKANIVWSWEGEQRTGFLDASGVQKAFGDQELHKGFRIMMSSRWENRKWPKWTKRIMPSWAFAPGKVG